MPQHTHVTQGARLPEDCLACASVWNDLYLLEPYVRFQDEFRVARTLREDYGDAEMVHHLTRVMEDAQKTKWKMGLT